MSSRFLLFLALVSLAAPPVFAADDNSSFLTTGNSEADVGHFRSLLRHLGFDIGALVPKGDFRQFSAAPLIGLHFSWDAIPPFSIILGLSHASAPATQGAAAGKLSVNEFDFATQASAPLGFFTPFVKVGAALYFNDVNFGSRYVLTGEDAFLTTVGVNFGGGMDIIVGRSMSVGFEAIYHLCLPKYLALSDGSTFDLGSSFITGALRLSF